MANAIFVAENMASTKLSSLLKTGRYQDGAGNDLAINNGCVVTLGGKMANERETYLALAPAAIANAIYVVDTPELIYSQETTSGLNDYTNRAGQLLRLRKLQIGDSFAVSARAITPVGAAPAVGNYLTTPAASVLWAEVAAAGIAANNASVQCLIEDSYVLGADPIGGRNITMYSVRVVTA